MATAAFRKIQWSKETVRGTAVACDNSLLGGSLRLTPEPEWFRPEDEDRGSLAMHYTQELVGQRAALRYEGAADFEQLIAFLAMTLKGGVTPSTPGGGTNSRDWVFAPSLTALNVQDAFTFQYGDDQQAYQVAFAVARQLELNFALNAPVGLTADMFALFPTKVSFTGSPATPTPERIVAAKTKLYLDTTWAGLGGTQKASLLMGGRVRLPSGLEPVKFADGVLDWSSVSENKRAAEVELVFVHDADGEAAYDDFVASTQRFIRIEVLGSLIEGALYKRLQVDLALRYVSMQPIGETQDGKSVVRLTARTFPDSSGNEMSVAVRNTQTALP